MVPGFTVLSVTAATMTAPLAARELTRAYCGDCRGTGFGGATRGDRHARRCQRCRGKGHTLVGHTKR